MGMTINEIITKWYAVFHQQATNTDIGYNGKTDEDVLNDVCVTAMKKFKDKDIDEEQGLEYLKKAFFYEKHFNPKRIDTKMVFTDNLEQYE